VMGLIQPVYTLVLVLINKVKIRVIYWCGWHWWHQCHYVLCGFLLFSDLQTCRDCFVRLAGFCEQSAYYLLKVIWSWLLSLPGTPGRR